jgi:subtilisin family serine protease
LVVYWRDQAPASLAMQGARAMHASATASRSVVIALPGAAGRLAATLRADPRVRAVVPDAVVHAAGWPADAPPSDPLFPRQTDLPQVHVPGAWKTTIGSPSVVIAVIDSGFDLAHPDLAGVPVVSPRNETWNTTDVTDQDGHGTLVAGTIFARTNDATGIAGIAPGVTLMPIKVLDGDGSGFFSDVLDAVDWARTHGANIINLSLGALLTPDQVALFQPTFTVARAAGLLIVAAAGNTGIGTRSYPASLDGVVSVAAVDASDTRADWSTFNSAVDLSAPGVDILSTSAFDPHGYESVSGTSFSSPIVAGIAALVWSARPTLTVNQLEAVLRTSATDLGAPGRDNLYGSGRVDAAAALRAPVPDPLPVLDPPPSPAGPMTVRFTSPTTAVRQKATTFTVSWTTSHAAADGVILRFAWQEIHGRCPAFAAPVYDYAVLPLVNPTRDTHLVPGLCYRYDVDVVDEGNNEGETISAPVSIVDLVPPRIVSRSPAAGATRVQGGTTVRIAFSEPVTGVSWRTLRLRNAETGRWVTARVTYSDASHSATIDPVLRMYGDTTYEVVVLRGIRDIAGNRLPAADWSFRTRR